MLFQSVSIFIHNGHRLQINASSLKYKMFETTTGRQLPRAVITAAQANGVLRILGDSNGNVSGEKNWFIQRIFVVLFIFKEEMKNHTNFSKWIYFQDFYFLSSDI